MTEPIAETPLADLTGGLSDAWACGLRAWSEFATDLIGMRTFDDLANAQTRLLINGWDIFGQAAGEMLRRHGLTAPTLNEP